MHAAFMRSLGRVFTGDPNPPVVVEPDDVKRGAAVSLICGQHSELSHWTAIFEFEGRTEYFRWQRHESGRLKKVVVTQQEYEDCSPSFPTVQYASDWEDGYFLVEFGQETWVSERVLRPELAACSGDSRRCAYDKRVIGEVDRICELTAMGEQGDRFGKIGYVYEVPPSLSKEYKEFLIGGEFQEHLIGWRHTSPAELLEKCQSNPLNGLQYDIMTENCQRWVAELLVTGYGFEEKKMPRDVAAAVGRAASSALEVGAISNGITSAVLNAVSMGDYSSMLEMTERGSVASSIELTLGNPVLVGLGLVLLTISGMSGGLAMLTDLMSE